MLRHTRGASAPFFFLAGIAVLICAPHAARAQSTTVFGPQTFIRSSAASDVFTSTFTAPDTSQPYTLTVTKGQEDGLVQVRKISVTLNGQQVITPQLLANRVQIMALVHPGQSNTISVKLKGGSAGSFITVSVGPLPNELLTDPNAPGFDSGCSDRSLLA